MDNFHGPHFHEGVQFVRVETKIHTCLLLIGGQKINNHYKNIVDPLEHPHLSKVQVPIEHFAKASCTNIVKVVFTKEGKTFSVKILWMESSPLGITEKSTFETKQTTQSLMAKNF
jgi:hypothetical protein